MNIDLEKEDIDELIDALTGRIAYYKRYAGNDRFAHLRMKQCEKLREHFNTLLKNANYSIIWIAKEELDIPKQEGTRMNNLYTVLDDNKKVLARNVNYEKAAIAILTLDGAAYTIDHIRGLWSLFTKSVSGNYNYFNPIETSYEKDFYKAREDIFRKIVERACAHDGWRAVAIEIKSVV